MQRSIEPYLGWWSPYFALTIGYRKALLASMQQAVDVWGRALVDQLENLPFSSSAGFIPQIRPADDQRVLRWWMHWQECIHRSMWSNHGLSDSLVLSALLSKPGSGSGDSDKILAQLIRLMAVASASSQPSEEPVAVARVRPEALGGMPPGRLSRSRRSGGQ